MDSQNKRNVSKESLVDTKEQLHKLNEGTRDIVFNTLARANFESYKVNDSV